MNSYEGATLFSPISYDKYKNVIMFRRRSNQLKDIINSRSSSVQGLLRDDSQEQSAKINVINFLATGHQDNNPTDKNPFLSVKKTNSFNMKRYQSRSDSERFRNTTGPQVHAISIRR